MKDDLKELRRIAYILDTKIKYRYTERQAPELKDAWQCFCKAQGMLFKAVHDLPEFCNCTGVGVHTGGSDGWFKCETCGLDKPVGWPTAKESIWKMKGSKSD